MDNVDASREKACLVFGVTELFPEQEKAFEILKQKGTKKADW